MLPAICTTQVKKRVKRGFKTKKKKQGYEKFSSRGFEPRPLKSIRTTVNTSVRWTTSVDDDN